MSKISDERREVAARLRERAQLSNFCPFESFFVRLNVIIFGDNGWDRTDGGVFERLADLIDPTCEMTDASWDNGECTWGCICSACDAHIEHEQGRFLDYCPSCGARVVSEHEE